MFFNEITSSATSVIFSVCDRKEITIALKAAEITTTGATLKVWGSPVYDDADFWAPIATVGADGIVRSEVDINTNAAYIFELVNSSSICFVKVELVITTGTYTAWMEAFN
jgi:hypothetical protein